MIFFMKYFTSRSLRFSIAIGLYMLCFVNCKHFSTFLLKYWAINYTQVMVKAHWPFVLIIHV